MQAYGGILCAGFGTRMRPLTEVVPKPLLPFLNTPLLTYGLALLAEAGIQRVAFNLHHLADTVPPVVDRLAPAFGIRPVYAREWEILGTAGGIAGLWKALGCPDAPLVVLNGDNVTDIALGPILEHHVASGAAVTLVVREKTEDQPGRVFLDGRGRLAGVRAFRRPGVVPSREVEFTGIHVLSPSALQRLSVDPGDVIDELYGPMVLGDEAIEAYVADGFWAALDTPKLLLQTTAQVLANPGVFRLSPLPGAGPHWVLAPEQTDDQAQFAAPVFLGMNTTVAAGTQIGPNVVMDGVEVMAGTVVNNAVIYGMGRLEGEWRDLVAVAGKVASAG